MMGFNPMSMGGGMDRMGGSDLQLILYTALQNLQFYITLLYVK